MNFDSIDRAYGMGIISLERMHLENLALMGHNEDERGRDIATRLEALDSQRPIPPNTREDRLHDVMSTDWQTMWMRKPLYENTYDGVQDEDIVMPYDFQLGRIIQLVNNWGNAIRAPSPFTFVPAKRRGDFFADLEDSIDRRQWSSLRISRNPKTGAVINNFLTAVIPLPYGYPWPPWAAGIRVYLFGEIVNTRWWSIYAHYAKRALVSHCGNR